MLDMSESKYTLSKRDFSLVDNKPKSNRFSYTGVTLRIGPSDLTGATIATIAIFNSSNDKTGNVIQVYFLPVDEHPIDAIKSGLDSAVCGDCILRPVNSPNKDDDSCYVRKFHGPAKVYRTFKAGRYPLVKDLPAKDKTKVLSILKSKTVRLGAYGDPLSDIETSIYLAAVNPQVLGYSHQWENAENHEWLQSFLMASVDSPQDYEQAKKQGWRTYRHTTDNMAFDNEIICPHKTHGTQCVDCGLCSGTNSGSDKDIVTKTLKRG